MPKVRLYIYKREFFISPNTSKVTLYNWFQVVVACLSLFALGWMDNARGPFFPLFLENAQVSATKGALFFALASFTAIISSALAGYVIRSFGLKVLLFLGGFLMMVCPFGLILIPNLTGALITAFLFGASLGFAAVGQNVLVGLIKNDQFRRRFFALLHCFYALAAMAAPVSILGLKAFFRWNELLIGVSFLAAPFAVSVLFLKKEKSKNNADKKLLPPKWTDFSSFIWVLFMSFYVSSELILTTRMVVLTEAFGVSFEEASLHLFYFFLFMFISRFFFFMIHPPFKETNILKLCILSAILLSGLGFVYNTFCFSLIGVFMGPVFPLVMEVLSKSWPRFFDTIISRVISLSSFFVVLAHMGVGRLTDLYGVQNALIVVPLFLSLSFCVLMYKTSIDSKKSV